MPASRKILILILITTIASIIIDIPKNLPIHLSLGSWKVNTLVSSPDISLALGNISLRREIRTRLGLDLLGGTQLTLEADMNNISPPDRQTAHEAVKDVIERRVNFFGVAEPIIQTSKVNDSYRVIVELPGIKDVNEAIDLIGKTAQLEFRTLEASPSAQAATSSALLYGFSNKTNLSGKDLRRSYVQFDNNTGQPIVSLEFSPLGGKKFEDITRANVGRPVAMVLDNQIISAPVVQEAITGGSAVIRGKFTTEEAKRLSIALNAGALPVPVTIIQQRNIGATIGDKAVRSSIVAGVIGFSAVALFMIVLYGRRGMIAIAALIIYSLVVLAIFKLLPVTLTLAGIAGFILSIGMAVDANILIFERIKEEIRWGKPESSATELGFSRAFPSIRDSNSSSLITCTILYWFGSGLIRGFALTLAIGVIVSLFSSITVTRTLLRVFQK